MTAITKVLFLEWRQNTRAGFDIFLILTYIQGFLC